MNIFSKALRAIKWGSAPARDPVVAEWWGGGNLSMTGASVTEATAMQSAAVFACVRVLAETVAQLPLNVYERAPDGGRSRADAHPLFPVLHLSPNEAQTSFEWREMFVGHMALRGVSYHQIFTDNSGRVVSLVPLHPDRTRPFQSPDGSIAFEHVTRDGQLRILLGHEVLYLPAMSDDLYTPLSPIRLHRETIGLGLGAREYMARFYSGSAQPKGAITYDKPLSDEAATMLRESWERRHKGLENSNKVAILDGGMKWQQIGMTNEDAQFLQTLAATNEDIARIFRVPPHKVGILDKATFCLPMDAEVMSERGPIRIADIRAGEKVWSMAPQGGLVLSRVARIACTGRDPILTIKTTNRAVRANARHRILTRRRHERPLRPGEVGGKNVDGRKVRVEWRTEYVPAGELAVGDTIVSFNGTPDTGRRVTPTRPATEGFVEFCGLYLGDGYMTKGQVTIARASHAQYMDHYRGVIRQEFQRYDGGNGRGNQIAVALAPVTLQEAERYTRFSSALAAQELTALGLVGTAHTKRVPDWVHGLADDLKLAFLRGFLDADGSVDKKGRASFSSCNKALLSGIRHLCMSLGVPVTNQRTQRGMTTLPNGRRIKFEQHSFTCSDPGGNRRIGSHTPEYCLRLDSGAPFDRKARAYPRFGGAGFDDSGTELSRISSIEIGETEPVYDMEVVGTHSFIADGVVVHNSNIEQQALEFVTDTLLPWLVRAEQRMNMALLTAPERLQYYVAFEVKGLLRGDFKARTEGYNKLFQVGAMSPNDIREREDMNPIEGGEKYYVPLNMADTETHGEVLAKGGGDSSPAAPDKSGEESENE